MTKKKNEHAGTFALIGLVLVLPFAAWYGFVVSKLWAWFVVPLGVTSLGVWSAAGVYLIARLLTFDTTVKRDEEKTAAERFGAGIALAVLSPAAALGFGAIYHAFA